jgi:opacity protein-like surface antigen
MRTLKIALLATVATAAFSSATFAADLIIADEPVIDNFATGFDWEGPYAGLYVSGQTSEFDDAFGIGADLGVNVLLDSSLLAGVEGNVAWLAGTPNSWQAQVHGKLGFVATDSAAIYGLLGVGFNSETDGYVPVGIGAEFALADNFTIKAEYQFQWDFEETVVGVSESAHVGKIGFNWHF